ncbi:hemoglobin subunit beta-1-like [Rhipicephalus microplus]|uniref:hemoglobin subunit beta-1-like n=1 Tax=Rhipicephalus microplus TaxID=6941 RepID=UPI003F6BE17A
MGNAARKTGELPDTVSGLTENEKNLIKNTWRAFCSNNRECGVLLFLSQFVRHPEYLPMFRNFRANNVAGLKDVPAFRAHGCAVGYHLTSMVDNILDPATFEVLVRRNATEHLQRQSVWPSHFEVMGEIVINVLQAKEERLMTPAAINAWRKFLSGSISRLERWK